LIFIRNSGFKGILVIWE